MRYYHILLDGEKQQATWTPIPVQILAWNEAEASRVFRADPGLCGSGLRRSELKGKTVVAILPGATPPDSSGQ